MSVTQTVYKELLNMPDYEPPRFGSDAQCWLCAGDTDGKGWLIKDAITSAFTDASLAACPKSQTMCQACVALMKKEAWQQACEKHGHTPFFPIKNGKKPAMANWMFSSHVFSKDGWLRPERKEIAGILLNPPSAPFVIVLAEVGKKHTIFKSKVSYSRTQYFVNLDEKTILVDLNKFKELLALVENAYKYFSKDSILTGNYNQAAVMAVGLSTWREIESQIKHWRGDDLLRLACFVARKGG